MEGQEDPAAMQEKFQNMSPEEQKQFQIQNCIFCQIVEGKVNSKKIYEDDKCLAILDINPANPGHVLLMPKEHYAIMPVIPEDVIKHLFMISKQMSAALLKALQAQGTDIFVANGAAAGQKAQHFMLHVIPRMENDGVNLNLTPGKVDEKVLDQLRQTLSQKINKDLGTELPEEVPRVDKNKPPLEKPKKESEEVKEEKEGKEESKTKEKEPEEEKTEVKEEKKEEKDSEEPEKEGKESVTLDDISKLITGG
jgi:histidine triad (HIT) family protein|tara:strand:+ start:421 stop:1176 length:756 start_codon:yes stop_codon:yes gene_type:complete